MDLSNASNVDLSFAQKKIDFCNEYIKRYDDDEQLSIQNMRIAIAESYIKLGKQNEGDMLFESYLKEDPQWGWGWIGWSDCYWIFNNSKNNDYEKAEKIFKRGLAIEGLRDRDIVLERLLNFYSDHDRKEEADEVERELDELTKNTKYAVGKNILQAISVKIGRNDPCTCGSGKKYKKCCGS